ncbi:peptidoglycan editing factor PgeF [Edaphovirga cremea]|uniref:peptidoglycan editing factor PgeF n=1 Tax=Edaphovirga cremea TaxID=2267246 RepID=UPI00398935DC
MTDESPLLSNIPSLRYGFGDKRSLMPASLSEYRHTLAEKKQVHGTRIVEVTHPGQICADADGFYTRQSGILLAVLTADCLPILFSRRDGKCIGVVHAGWRGLLDGIIERMADQINHYDSTADWVVSIGPAARSCCYQVSEELVDTFLQTLPDIPPEVISPRERHLDLSAVAVHKIRQLGFYDVDVAGHCTICTLSGEPENGPRFKYTSFRRNSHRQKQDPMHPGIRGRNQYSGLVIHQP